MRPGGIRRGDCLGRALFRRQAQRRSVRRSPEVPRVGSGECAHFAKCAAQHCSGARQFWRVSRTERAEYERNAEPGTPANRRRATGFGLRRSPFYGFQVFNGKTAEGRRWLSLTLGCNSAPLMVFTRNNEKNLCSSLLGGFAHAWCIGFECLKTLGCLSWCSAGTVCWVHKRCAEHICQHAFRTPSGVHSKVACIGNECSLVHYRKSPGAQNRAISLCRFLRQNKHASTALWHRVAECS